MLDIKFLELAQKYVNNTVDHCDILSIEEVKYISKYIRDGLYEARVRDFMDFLYDSIESSTDDPDTFYAHDFTIYYGGKVVNIHNDATFIQNLVDNFEEYYNDVLGCRYSTKTERMAINNLVTEALDAYETTHGEIDRAGFGTYSYKILNNILTKTRFDKLD